MNGYKSRRHSFSILTPAMTYRVVLILFLVKLSLIFGYPSFKDKIPNGETVPHPCKPNYLWRGVGHRNPLGGGEENVFGEDFLKAGKEWTKDLCQKDSDGDGRTNGEELGDPECTWSEGEVPKTSLGLTHPGVCDPYDDPVCKTKNDWISCDLEELKCDAINEVSTKNITVRFPETEVPNQETNYYCMMFELPIDGDYHIVASKPYIDNAEVMHHILVYGCDETYEEITNVEFNKPYPCDMGNSRCTSIISGWTVGSSGECAHKNSAYRIGTKGYKKALFQFHWNNPQLKTGYKDSSGMTIYYTPELRPYDAMMLLVGQNYFEIPPGKREVSIEGICSSDCSRELLKGPVYVTKAFNHMHYLGRQQFIEHYRNGTKVRDFTKEEVYSYDSPTFYAFEDPYEILPGDEIKTTCVFKSVGKPLTTFKGDGTSDEMCFGFLTVYPAQNLPIPYCTSWKSIQECKYWFNKDIDGCSLTTFKNSSHPEMVQLRTDVLKRCVPFGNCLEECKEYVKTLKTTHPCLMNDIGHRLRNEHVARDVEMATFYVALDSCNAEIEKDKCQCVGDGIGSASGAIASFFTIMSALFMIHLLN